MPDLLDRLKAALADRYRVDREIGRGGMAHVFLAHDLKLDRPVALKVLRPDLAAVLGGERFLREITLAAKLEHPHILGIHDSGEADGLLYYVMPYVDGESLRGKLDREKQLPLDEALQIAREVADALSYAHVRGVIHRDIKPENILLESGHAVVADFGIARAIDAAGGDRLTETGVALGTPAYMSPEQAAGSGDLDGRSDLYSLGCVLYEMLAGQPPFTGPTIESVVAQHLSAPPPDVTHIRPSVPSWVTAALERSLAKTPADRFNPVAQFGEAISPRVSAMATDARPLPAASGRGRWLVPSVLAAALLIVVGAVLVWMMGSTPISITTSNSRAVTTEPGLEFQPAISQDGEDVAYVVGPIGRPRIFVRSAVEGGIGGQTSLGEDLGGFHWLPAWSPDGTGLRFLACASRFTAGIPGDCGDWKEVGAHGGPARTVGVRRVSSRYAWSPDGMRVAFAVQDSIFAYAADDGEPELLGVHAETGEIQRPHSLTWSPDGRLIAYVNRNGQWVNSTNVNNASIWILDASGGEPIPVTDEDHLNVSPQWLPDSRHLLFVSDREGQREVYVLKVGPAGPRGEPQKVPGTTDAHSISISADGRRLAYAKFPAVQNIWSIPIPRSGSVSIRDAIPVTAGSQVVESHALSPDGAWIAFDSNLRGQQGIYKRRVQGGDPQPVAKMTSHAYSPAWSPDGTEIAFYSGSEDAEIFVVPAGGGSPEQLTDFPGTEMNPVWSPDGITIAFNSAGPEGDGPPNVWTMSRDGAGLSWSDPEQLTRFGNCQGPVWDPDGASLLCYVLREGWARVSREGEVLWRYDPTTAGRSTYFYIPQFSPDGSRIYFCATDPDGSEGIWWIPANGGDATKIVEFDDPSLTVFGFLTVGPSNLYLTVAEYESDIWVMDLEW